MKRITVSVVMSNRLDLRRRLLLLLFRRRKYFWAWLATWVGVRVLTKFLEIPLQSPFPTLFNPTRNSRCSSSVHGTPIQIKIDRRVKITKHVLISLNRCNYLFSGLGNEQKDEWRHRRRSRRHLYWNLEAGSRTELDYSCSHSSWRKIRLPSIGHRITWYFFRCYWRGRRRWWYYQWTPSSCRA